MMHGQNNIKFVPKFPEIFEILDNRYYETIMLKVLKTGKDTYVHDTRFTHNEDQGSMSLHNIRTNFHYMYWTHHETSPFKSTVMSICLLLNKHKTFHRYEVCAKNHKKINFPIQ